MWLQLKYYLGMLLYLPAFPVLFWQGKKLKQKFRRLPAAANPAGLVGDAENAISVFALGESTVAGLGVNEHTEGITGQFAKFYQEQTARGVRWEVLAKTGYTAFDTLQHLVPKLPSAAPDILLIGLAANNVFALNSPLKWRREMEDLIINISVVWPDTKMVLLNLPPVETFPGLTGLMRSIFGNLMNLYHPVNVQLAQTFENLWYCEKRINIEEWMVLIPEAKNISDFYSDGVHPNGSTYSAWAKETVNFVLEKKLVD